MKESLGRSKTLAACTRWVRFDSSMLMPSMIPREAEHADRDLLVYENVMAIVENGGQSGFVQIGELVQVGDVWKLTGLPQPMEGDSLQVVSGGVLMQPTAAALSEAASNLSPEVQKLIEQLQKLDEAAPQPTAGAEAISRYNVARAKLLSQLAAAADGAADKELWRRQQIELIAAATQMEVYPNGVAELDSLEKELRRAGPNSPLLPVVVYHRLYCDYNLRLRAADAEQRETIQTAWVQSLEQFVKDYPASEDAADALLQLGVSQEFIGKPDEAIKWYDRLVKEHRDNPSAQRGAGALRRLKLVGNPLPLAGAGLTGGKLDVSAYRGKVLVVAFWATWCKPCTEELPQLIELHRANRAAGFEILGVCLDSPGPDPKAPLAAVQQYIQEHKTPWPHIYEEGGLDSRPALEFGIFTLPTMFLVDKQGRVVSAGTSLADLKAKLPDLLKP